MKLIRHTVLASCLAAAAGTSQAIPVTYILDGYASGSYDGVSFTNRRLGILMEGDTDTVAAGGEPYSPGDHPEYRWFTQASLNRIQVLFPETTLQPPIPYPMGLANPLSFQLMSWNFGPYTSTTGQQSNPFAAVALCASGLGPYNCFGTGFWSDPPVFSGGAQPFLDLTSEYTSLVTDLSFNFALMTTRDGLLRIDNLSGARLAVAPVPEPATSLLLVAGLGLTGYVVRRRQRREPVNAGHTLPALAPAS